MTTITTNKNWCSIDQLDGKDLEHGEKLKLQWPDGTVERVQIIVKKRTVGNRDPIEEREAFVEKSIHRVIVLVPVKGLKAERV